MRCLLFKKKKKKRLWLWLVYAGEKYLTSIYTRSLAPFISAHGMSFYCYADDTQIFLSFPPSETQISTHISACLRDIQSWMDNHYQKLFIPALTSPFSDFSISQGHTTVTSSPSARNLGVVMDNRLSLSENIAAVTRACRFFLYNIHRSHPFLTIYSTCSSNGPAPPGLLQLSAGWPPGIHHQAPTTNPEGRGSSGIQHPQTLSHQSPTHWPPLTAC